MFMRVEILFPWENSAMKNTCFESGCLAALREKKKTKQEVKGIKTIAINLESV